MVTAIRRDNMTTPTLLDTTRFDGEGFMTDPHDWTPEIGVAMGIGAYALLGFTLGVRYLALYPRSGETSST